METSTVYKLTKGRELHIVYDTMAENPRKCWDNFATFVGIQSKYELFDLYAYSIEEVVQHIIGELSKYTDKYKCASKGIAELARVIGEETWKVLSVIEKHAIILPIFMYEHGGATISTCKFSCQWDSGQVGFAFITKVKVMDSYKKVRVTDRLRGIVEDCIKSEIETLDAYITGDVYGYRVVDKNECVEDACYGFYGHNIILNGILDNFEKGDQRKVMLQMPLYEVKEYRESKKKLFRTI
jgi:hypothetical protein